MTVGWFPLLAAAARNGAVINVDGFMTGADGSGGGFFLNAFHGWNGVIKEPEKHDAKGYPKESLALDVPGTLRIPPQMQGPSEQWVIKTTGTRKMRVLMDLPINFVSETGGASHTGGGGGGGGMTVSFASQGRVVFTFATTGYVSTYFKSGGTFDTGTGELVICRVSDETKISNGEYWTQEALDFLADGHHQCLRFMPWMVSGPNVNNEVKWDYRITPDYAGWLTESFHPDVWCGDTSGTDTYTLTTSAPDVPGSITANEVLQCRFKETNTSTAPTMNANGRGQITIVSRTGNALGLGEIIDEALATLIYNELLNAYIYYPHGFIPQVPIEAQVDLCNRLGMWFWGCFPFLADDDYITNRTTYVRDNLDPSLYAYEEYANEVWNFAFPHTTLAVNMGQALGFPVDNNQRYHGYYGLRVRQIMGLITTLWSGHSNLRRVLAWQCRSSVAQIELYRISGDDLSTSKGYTGYNSYVGVSYNTEGQRPGDWVDVFSYAPYYFGANFSKAGVYSTDNAAVLNDAAADYASGNPSRMADALAWLDNDIRQGEVLGVVGADTLKTFNDDVYPAWNTVAVTWNKPVDCYETAFESAAPSEATCSAIGVTLGGPTGAADASAALTALLEAYKNSDYDGQRLSTQFSQWLSNSKSRMPSQFVLLGPSQWAVFPGDIYSTPYQSYVALRTFNGG